MGSPHRRQERGREPAVGEERMAAALPKNPAAAAKGEAAVNPAPSARREREIPMTDILQPPLPSDMPPMPGGMERKRTCGGECLRRGTRGCGLGPGAWEAATGGALCRACAEAGPDPLGRATHVLCLHRPATAGWGGAQRWEVRVRGLVAGDRPESKDEDAAARSVYSSTARLTSPKMLLSKLTCGLKNPQKFTMRLCMSCSRRLAALWLMMA
ncbi:uncharacterized protein [Miscanthus floridulus]|uniref:uncharacterized protein n=1 Tax=Miscanthus floridulus TaxID=154761 RepID=UPI0034599513